MNKATLLKKAVSLAVCLGMALSSSSTAFSGQGTTARDIELTADGVLRGQVFTSEGRAVPNAQVELRYRGQAVAKATTGQQGEFLISNVRGGAHELAVGSLESPVRVWKSGTAPDGAIEGIVISADEDIVRGQACDPYGNPVAACPPTSTGFGLIDVVTLAMLGTAVTSTVIAIDTNNQIDDLEEQLDQLASP
jgi:hypothetical protein